MVTKPASTAGTAFATSGAKIKAARKPSTTLGRLAMSSMVGLIFDLTRGCRNSLVNMAAAVPTALPNSMEYTVALSVPKISGRNPNLAQKSWLAEDDCHRCMGRL